MKLSVFIESTSKDFHKIKDNDPIKSRLANFHTNLTFRFGTCFIIFDQNSICE
ncbi:hypothetical protein LEP1GSC173_1064 [Leptospira interrogans str. HAI1594]|uniref:Uncharacterized protein n=2 Tax=Leptospira interrogans TaxID=173 RepID=M6R8R4_LEPIR|nr:hypothetical protein [Leptospira interrogans]EKP23693.1 hypothetical protein LEP1GSC117_3760 [Leptospira interrogans serovar Icterohaemorrhagiae str. Verdun LP]EKP76058.1 hypothetical protein LEP1GSC173_1064 [Leptospira interrogans str. HAI1594]EKR34733.1 hypothetical protein LEP1GSC096_3142 [Leptospira interrogans serovar Hebdomadis str. R499]EMF71080.1 hypothetical protein LEP1GSC148_4512 [Leptospira interrogans serovar Canicola str. LT1962]EMG19563.1 hypothetical protein LEP1GSC150_2536 